ncbi:DUF5591 domain-containing protein [Geoglobus acetivorans]|uniref:Archaeosine tRNA-ribosyltransferase type 2 n=1 Tax=Geoglobus acetivorans TaxID=565033 RepID=A0A0A7GGS5_GEOAI|nr:archaeosine tRNA-ribosyltransferase type 2 [Geoglobus acetivorans]
MRFRIEKQDGFARLGKIGEYTTPHLIDIRDEDEVEFFEALTERRPPEAVRRILPETYKAFLKSGMIRKAVTGNELPKDKIEIILEAGKGAKPLYVPAIALPWNAALLIYAGADILDNALSLKKAYEGIYLTEAGELKIESLKELPCSCEACMNREQYRNDFEFLSEHNTLILQKEVKLARTALRNESLRELAEMRVKASPETTSMLRIFDRVSDIPFARFRKSSVYPNSEDSFFRPDFRYYFERLYETYDPKSHIALLLPCSARKPYMLSKSHRRIRSALGSALKGVNEVIISSPFISPREFELLYPIAFYDTPTTGVWSDWEVDFVAEKLAGLLNRFERVVAYLHGGYRKVAEKAGDMAGKDIKFFEDLKDLRRVLDNEEKENFDLYKEIFRHMTRYQFGVEFEIDRVRGRYPELEFLRGERVARIDPRYGNLDIYAPLATYLKEAGSYTVEIAEFEVKGTIFSQGVLNADEKIRPNDVVVYYNSITTGVGQAVIPGKYMGEVDGRAITSRRKIK